MKKLRTPLQVVEFLGKERVAELTKSDAKQVWHWCARAGKFPAHTYVALQKALKRRDVQVSDRLWHMTGVD